MNVIPNDGRDSRNRVSTHSYSGSDFEIYAYVDTSDFFGEDSSLADRVDQGVLGALKEENKVIKLGNVQTITSSMAASLSAVNNIGDSQAAGFTRGQKTYAGSLIFTVLNKDPLNEILEKHSDFYRDAFSDFVSADELPPLNIVIKGTSENVSKVEDKSSRFSDVYATDSITKIIYGLKLMQHGETISIDDFFTEQTYQYVARHVTGWKRETEQFPIYKKRSPEFGGKTKSNVVIDRPKPKGPIVRSHVNPDILQNRVDTSIENDISNRLSALRPKIDLQPTNISL